MASLLFIPWSAPSDASAVVDIEAVAVADIELDQWPLAPKEAEKGRGRRRRRREKTATKRMKRKGSSCHDDMTRTGTEMPGDAEPCCCSDSH
jgi:hypothetical protein